MLKRLELNFFKKHEHLVVDFTGGLNGIVGANYRGKSTLLQGVMFCLGGSRMVPGKRLATRGTNSGFKTSLWFTIPGKGDYWVERTKTAANLYRLSDAGERERVAAGTSPVNTAIAELLGMNLRRFAQIKVARQKLADALLRFNSSELFQIVSELTGIDRVQRVLQLLENDLKALRHIADSTPVVDLTKNEHILSDSLARQEAAKAAFDALSAECNRLEHDLAEAHTKTEVLSQQYNSVASKEMDVKRIQQVLGERQARFDRASEALAKQAVVAGLNLAEERTRLVSLREKAKKARALAVEVRSLSDEVNAQARELGRWEASLQAAKAKLAAALEAEVPGEREELERQLDELRPTLPDLRHAYEHAKAVQRDGWCQACKRPMDNVDPVQAKADMDAAFAAWEARGLEVGKVEDLLQEAASREAAVTVAKQEVARQTRNVDDYHSAGARIRAALAEKTEALQASRPAAELEEEAEALANQIAAEEHALKGRSAAEREQQEALTALEEVRAQYDEASTDFLLALQGAGVKQTTELLHLRGDASQYETLLITKTREKRDEVDEARRAWGSLSAIIQLAEQELARDRLQNERAEEAAGKVAGAERLQGVLRANRDRYSRQVWEVFMASASMFASQVTGGKIESIARGEDGAFTFMEDGFEMSLDEGSGAQLAIIGVAVQLALAEAAQCPLNVLLMDEPTADMDAEHALAFSTLLASTGKQVVMVTHREFDGSVFDNTISL